jgi:hypothetical protein
MPNPVTSGGSPVAAVSEDEPVNILTFGQVNSGCQFHCRFGGVITILSPGQHGTTVA